MRRAALLALLALAPACDDEPSQPASQSPDAQWPALPDAPTTRDVVDAAIAAAGTTTDLVPFDEGLRDDFEGLLGFVEGSAGDMRRVGAQDLWRLGDGVGTALRDAALDPERGDAARAAALEVLGAGEAADAEPALLAILGDAPEAWVRSSAAWYLGESSGEGWICDAVLRLKYETDESVVVYLAQALGKHDVAAGLSGLEVISRSSWSEDQRAAAEAVIEEMVVEDDTRFFTPRPRDARFDAAVWRWIARLSEFQLRGVDDARFILKNLGADVVPHLAQALSDDDRYVRLHGCQCLERMGHKASGAVDALLEQLGSPDLGPQAAATLGAVTFDGSPAVRDALVGLMQNETAPPGLRLGATRGLVSARDSLALEAVLDQFERARESWPELAQAAAEALVAMEALSSTPRDGSPLDRAVREAMRFAIACLDTPGLDPASTGAVWQASSFVDGADGHFEGVEGFEAFNALPEDWYASEAKRGPQFDAAAMWKERRELLERALGVVLE